MLDLQFVRQQFPAFSEPSLQQSAFFENAGGSYMCVQVMNRLSTYYHETKVQPYHLYPQAQRAGAQMDAAYVELAKWLNVKADNIYMGPSTSQNSYVLAQAMLGWLQPGDEVIVTNQDHEANSGAWRRLESQGIVIKEWSVDPATGSLSTAQLESLYSAATKALVFPHCSNILGEINPVAEICAGAKARGVFSVVDGVSYAGHGLADISALGADIYMFSLYKVYGPHQGVMVVSDAMAEKLSNQGHFFNAHLREKRLTPAGPDHAQIAASTGVCDYFEAVYRHHFDDADSVSDSEKADRVHQLFLEAEKKALTPLMNYLNSEPKIRIIGPNTVEGRAPTVSIVVEGKKSMELAAALGERGIMCGAGHFYSLRLLEAMGVETEQGVLRFSLVHYTGEADVAKLIDELKLVI